MRTEIRKQILESIETKLRLVSDNNFIVELERIAGRMITALKSGKRIFIAGNGGSAADSQHFAAELAGKFIHDRKGLPVIALTTNSSIITAIANDFGYEYVFSRQIEGLGQPGDIFIGISTSGNSINILKAVQESKKMGLTTIGILGNGGGKINDLCDLRLIVPSTNTQYIQESHIVIIHQICSIIDNAFKNNR